MGKKSETKEQEITLKGFEVVKKNEEWKKDKVTVKRALVNKRGLYVFHCYLAEKYKAQCNTVDEVLEWAGKPVK